MRGQTGEILWYEDRHNPVVGWRGRRGRLETDSQIPNSVRGLDGEVIHKKREHKR